ncbi:CHCH domain-containing protein [Colletotrichum higginsianum IMI 349063]|uniref:Mitochondrial intermembrane space import and assembly protein 40 n=2 Tax=Colletotrichum higginsianum TaxID=80884 RepID=A0A1B7YM63_COLHI|nr:CHCH domain-containing protein [Colletotrichum higginsianum IMI 349063]OBR12998.1 CHCH domain-containing protein [Colletotrichum higginsianum IMI 349063]TIC99079.1 Mitochondrial intermembrane space import and assembly protein 40 [Colletotrichum higginsianum]
MYRSAVRSTPRAVSAARQSAIRAAPRRFASTTPADKPRSWKGAALRWGLAAGAVYWYNTSPVFAEEPLPRTIPAPSQFSESDLTTVDAIVEEKRKRAIVKAEEAKPAPAAAPVPTEASEKTQEVLQGGEDAPAPGSPEALEAEAGQQGAFNPETGEINWDCPCLGGMADGPCGEEFKAAFSCFVYSNEEPKGMDCIEKFQGMQTCFRKYPDIYGAELADDDEAPEGAPPAPDASTDATDAPPAAKKETKADSPDQAPRAEIKSESEEKKAAAKPDAQEQKKEAPKVPEPEPVDLTQPNTKATDATAANNNN